MTVKLEAILSIEDSLAGRLQKTWRKLSKQYKAQVTKALDANDPVAAQEVADSVDMTPVYTENVEYIRMQTYASLMHGATRLTDNPRDTSVTTGAYAPAVEKVMAQFKAQIVGSVTAQVQKELVNLIAREFYEAPVEVQVKKYNPYHDPKTGRFTSGPKQPATEQMMDELWKRSQPHPFDPKIRMMNVHPDHTDDLVGIEARPFNNRVHLSSIITFSEKGQGAASRALSRFTEMADRHQVELDGHVKPIDNAGDPQKPSLTREQLHKWYAKHGFEIEKGNNIVRYPKSALVAKYSQTQPRYPKGHPQGGQWTKTDQRMARAEAQGYDINRIWYHGRQGDFEAFDPSRSKHAEAVYLTPNANMAAHFANYNWQWNDSQRGENIMPLVLPKNLRIFDYENPKHLEGLSNHLAAKTGKALDETQELQASNNTTIHGTIDYFVGQVGRGSWPYVESELVQDYIKSKYHGFNVTEQGKVKNVAIYNPAMIRSVWAEFEADQWRSGNVLKFDADQPRWPEGHPKGGQWMDSEHLSANFVVDDLNAVGMTPNMYDYYKDPDYFRDSKGLVTKVVWMAPDDYLREAGQILADKSNGRSTLEDVLAGREANTETIDWLADAISSGKKVAAPYINRRKGREGQEGMHRSLAAKKLGLTAIPVMLIEDNLVTLQKYDSNQPRHPAGSKEGGRWSKKINLTGYAKLVRDRANSLTWYHGSKVKIDIDRLDPDKPIYLSESARYASYYAAGEATGSPLSFNAARHTPLPDITYEEWDAQIEESLRQLGSLGLNDAEKKRYSELIGLKNDYDDFKSLFEILSPEDMESANHQKIAERLALFEDVRDEFEALDSKRQERYDDHQRHMQVVHQRYGSPQIFPVDVEIKNPYLTTSEDYIYNLGYDDEGVQRLLDQGYDSVAWTVAAGEGDRDGFDEFGTMQGYAYGSELLIIDPEAIKKIRSVYRKMDGTKHLSLSGVFVQKYDVNQPRYPKGHPKGGQWMKGGATTPEGPSWGKAFGTAAAAQQEALQAHSRIAHESDGDALVRALGMNPDDVLQRLVDRQAAFSADGNNRGIRVDADLEGPTYRMEEFERMLDFFPEHTIENFVRREGEPFTVPDTPPQIDLMTPKMCFSNCAELTAMTFSDDGKYDYVEGYVIDTRLPFPIHHAWLADKGTGEVVDPTMGWRPTAAYYGIKMDRGYVRKKLVQNGYYGILTDGARPNDIVLGTDEDFDYK